MGDIFMEIVQEKFDRKLKEATEEAVEKAVEEAVEKAVEKATEEATEKATERTKMMECISLVQKKYIKNKPLPVIADELETEPEELLSIYNIVSKNPEKTVEELYELAAGAEEAS